jgi:HEAT repeat protein
VQRAAVRALAARGDEPASIAHLQELAARNDVDPYVRCRAALLVPGEPSEAVQASVRKGWQSTPLWLALPCATADAVRGSEDALVVVQEALSTGAIALDPDFVHTLGMQSLDGMDAAMIRGLSTADELVRPAYTSVLLARGHEEALEQVRASFSDPDPLVRMEGVLLLAPIDTPAALAMLSRAAADQTPEGRVASLVIAARQGLGFKAFEEAWSGDNRDVRRAAIGFAAEHVLRQEAAGSRSARKRLEGLLAEALVDPDPITRTEALRQVGRTGMASLVPVVEALLLDDEAEDIVRIAAAAALVRLGAAT